MKPDTNTIINKLITYAFDNLLLDPLDETYTLNRIATACGVVAPVGYEDADYGDATLTELLADLKAACPTADVTAVKNALIPMPRTVSGYFNDALEKSADKALNFLYELYERCDGNVSVCPACEKDGYTAYNKTGVTPLKTVALNGAYYVPLCVANRVALLEAEDILIEDVLSRESAFVTAYGGAIAYRLGDAAYLSASGIALTKAAAKKALSDSPVKVTLLDYPVPALAFNGIAKNAVMREVMRVVKAAKAAELDFVVAAAAKDGVTFYVVFASDVAANEYVVETDALTACGVYAVNDYSALLSVLEKGTALSTDLAEFKPIYDAIGGVKHGAKAAAALGGYLAEKLFSALAAAQSATEQTVELLVRQDA